MDGNDERLLAAPENIPPADPRFTSIAHDARNALAAAVSHLFEMPEIRDEKALHVWMWAICLTVLAHDVSDAAIAVSSSSDSLRAARILNRSLGEYAARQCLYFRDAELAHAQFGEALAMLRRVVKPLGKSRPNQPLSEFAHLLNSGTTKASQPKTVVMFEAQVIMLAPNSPKIALYVEFLEAEYALSTGFAHGSQATFFDLSNEGSVFARTRSLHRTSEILRCVASMIAIVRAIEIHFEIDLQTRTLLNMLRPVLPKANPTIATHNALLTLLFESIGG